MAQILVRHLEDEVVQRLKLRAGRNGRSLQEEVAQIPRRESQQRTMDEAPAEAEAIRRRLAGRGFSESADLIREDREQ